MALIDVTTTSWSAPVTLTSAEIWEVRGGPVFITTDAAEAALGGLRAEDGWVARFETGQAGLRWRVPAGGFGQIVRVAVV